MNINRDLVKRLKVYSEKFREDVDEFIEFIQCNEDACSRENTVAHFTASGLVVRDDKVLLIYHNKLEKFLQPGGHIEITDKTVLDAAKREVLEEVGLRVKEGKFGGNIVHIDAHKIPENPKKGEGEHMHYDCLFVFELDDAELITLQEEEVSGFKWVPFDYDFGVDALSEVISKIKNKY